MASGFAGMLSPDYFTRPDPHADQCRRYGGIATAGVAVAAGENSMRILLLLTLSVLLAAPAGAVVRVADLYEAQVPVADQGEAERARALAEALAEVAVRVSGLQRAREAEPVRQAAGDAQRLVQQYRYLPADNGGLMFQARFDPAAVEQLLEQAGLPLWGRERPLTLAWLAVQDGTGRSIAAADAPGPAAQALRQLTRARGLPTVLPLMDLEDQAQVRFTDIWGGFHEPVVAASRRYGAEAVLIGRIERVAADHWRARWTLVLADREHHWQGGGDRLETAVASAVDELAQTLAARFAVDSGGTGVRPLLLTVTDVTTVEEYARVDRYLHSRGFIRSVRLREVTADGLRYELEVPGDADSLRRLLALSEHLAPVSAEPVPGAPPAADELRYRLIP